MIYSHPVKFLRWLLLGREVTNLILEARQVIQMQQRRMKELELEGARATLNVALGWRLSQETPEIDFRDELDAAIQDLSDQVARLEEHVT